MKQVASHFGGTRNALAISWPKRVRTSNKFRSQFHHVVDSFPTLLETAGIDVPEYVNGILQKPIHGKSMLYSFDNGDSPSTRKSQYFEILGNRALYHDGWIASCFHGRLPWIRFAGYEFDGEEERWELYNITEDFSQSKDLAHVYPDKLDFLIKKFDEEAKRYEVYPLRDAGSRRGGDYAVPHSLDGYDRVVYNDKHFRMPEFSVLNLKNVLQHYRKIELGKTENSCDRLSGRRDGRVGNFSSKTGMLKFIYNWFGKEFTFAPRRHSPWHSRDQNKLYP